MSIQDRPKLISRSAMGFFSGTMISRVCGFARDLAMAFSLGSTAALAAFLTAYRFANLLRRLFGESSMSYGFVPHFEELRHSDPKRAVRFFCSILFTFGCILSVILVLLGVGLWGGNHLFAVDPQIRLILKCMMFMLPGVLFISLFGISAAFLQCERSYFIPGVSPVLFNLTWAGAAILVKSLPSDQAMYGLSFAIVLAFFLQWLFLLPQVYSFMKPHLKGEKLKELFCISPDLKKVLKPFLLGILGIGATQINSALDDLFALHAHPEGPAHLWYAIRYYQLPLALFGLALSTAVLPPLSRAMEEGNLDRYKELLRYSLKRISTLMIGASLFIFVIAAPAFHLLYGHGALSDTAISSICHSLWSYTIGLLPHGFVLILAPAFYARKDFKVPMWGAIYSVIANVFLNSMFVYVGHAGIYSVALATGLSSIVNFLYLHHKLKQTTGSVFDRDFFSHMARVIGMCSGAAALTLALGRTLFNDPTLDLVFQNVSLYFNLSFSQHFITMLSEFALFGSGLLILGKIFKVDEIKQLLSFKKQM